MPTGGLWPIIYLVALFLAGFFFLYSMLHFYLLVRAKADLPLGPGGALLLALFLVLMITVPVLTRSFENAGLTSLARLAAFTGYTWMALLFLFFCASILIDLWRLAVYITDAAIRETPLWLRPSARSCFLLACAVAAAVASYGWFEARMIRTERVRLSSPKIPAHIGPLRIVQISDIHLGLTVGPERLRRIVDLVRKAKPDILVSTGDLVDGQMTYRDGAMELLETIAPPLGKFAVTGNHEFYAGLDRSLAFTTKAGFRVLRGEAVTVHDIINIVGVDDPAGPGYGSSSTGESALLSSVKNGKLTLLLKHRPVVDRESMDLFDLQLSGHVHDGQIFPFRLITRFFYPLVAGLYSFSPHGSFLYVSRGSGTWGPPVRFLAPPEITVIDLIGRSP